MNAKLTEDSIEQNLIDLLKKQGFEYFHGADIAPYTENTQREGFDSVTQCKYNKIIDKINSVRINR